MDLKDFAERQKVNKKIEYISNPNLLDNWYFADPVNSSGFSNGVPLYDMSIDRWFSNDVAVSVNDGYITLAQSGTSNLFFIQRVRPEFYRKFIAGKQITISVLLKDGSLKTCTVIAPNFKSNSAGEIVDNGLRLGVFSLENEHGFRIFPDVGYQFDIVAVKAEIGSLQTLARRKENIWILNDVPNYDEQINICKQYNRHGYYTGLIYNNPNLLDNWYFGNPVNREGGTLIVPPGVEYMYQESTNVAGVTDAYYYTTQRDQYGNAGVTINDTMYWVYGSNVFPGYKKDGYTIDRWKMWIDVGTILVQPDGILLDATDNPITWSQQAEPSLSSCLVGKTVTMSILYTAVTDLTPDTAIMIEVPGAVLNQLRLGTNAGVTDCKSLSFTFPENVKHPCWIYVARGEKIKIHAVKLELGSQQTLAHKENGVWVLNEIPKYAEQMATCSQYDIDGNYIGQHTITSGTTDLVAGSSQMASNTIYLKYE